MNLRTRSIILTGGLAALAIATPVPTAAMSFDFSYTFRTGEALSGTLEGDLTAADPNFIADVSITSASFASVDGLFDLNLSGCDRQLGCFVTLDGSQVVLWASGAAPAASFFIDSGGPVLNQVGLYLQGVGSIDDGSFDASRWRVSTSVPEPSATITFAVGVFLVGGALRRSRRS